MACLLWVVSSVAINTDVQRSWLFSVVDMMQPRDTREARPSNEELSITLASGHICEELHITMVNTGGSSPLWVVSRPRQVAQGCRKRKESRESHGLQVSKQHS